MWANTKLPMKLQRDVMKDSYDTIFSPLRTVKSPHSKISLSLFLLTKSSASSYVDTILTMSYWSRLRVWPYALLANSLPKAFLAEFPDSSPSFFKVLHFMIHGFMISFCDSQYMHFEIPKTLPPEAIISATSTDVRTSVRRSTVYLVLPFYLYCTTGSKFIGFSSKST